MNVRTQLLVVSALLALAGPSAASDAHYAQWVEQARQGDYAPLMAYFSRQEQTQQPLSASEVNDWILVSNWAQEDEKTIAVYQRYRQTVALQAGSLAAVGRAHRNLHHWDLAASILLLAIERDPHQGDWYLSAVGALSEGGQWDAARDLVMQFATQFPNRRLDGLLARVNIEWAAHQPYAALPFASEALELAPDDAHVQGTYVRALREAGLAERALQTIHAKGWTWADAATVRALQLSYAAEMVRIATTDANSEEERLVVAHRALDYYEPLLKQWQAQPSDTQLSQDIRHARLDRLVVLWRIKDAPRIVSEYEQLVAENAALPDYALMSVAAAMLHQKRPYEALEMYRGVVARTKNSDPEMYEDAQLGMFYALVETEDLDGARRYAQTYLAEEPVFVRAPGSETLLPNSRWAEAQREIGYAQLFADRLAEAQRTFEPLVALGPGDSNTRMALASTYRNRGLPRLAAQELKIAEANENPRAPSLMLEQAGVAQQLQDWPTAHALIEDVAQRFPEDPQAQKALKDWQRSQRAEVRMTAEYSDSKSPAALGEGAMRYALTAYSAPLAYNWRLYTQLSRGSGRYLEGYGQFNQIRFGAEWRYRDTNAEFDVGSLRASDHSYTGARVRVSQDLGDHWQIYGDAALKTSEAPLRALRMGITANEANVGVRWQANESTSLQLSSGWMDFSDGNQRWSLRLAGSQRLLTLTRVQLDANAELYRSRNSRPGGPYFAPTNDWSVLPGLTMRHLIWREYDRTWRQELFGSAGTYYQQGYGRGGFQQLRYGQQIRWDEGLEFGFQTGLNWRPYDGVRERALFFGLNLNYWF